MDGRGGQAKVQPPRPVTVFDGQELQDGGVYLARPQPLAVEGGVEYVLQQDGKRIGLFDIDNSGQEQGSWVGLGSWKPMPQAEGEARAGNWRRTTWTMREATIPCCIASTLPATRRAAVPEAGQAPLPPTRIGPRCTRRPPATMQAVRAAHRRPDPDRPTLHKPTPSDDSANEPAPDPDRPRLKKPKPNKESLPRPSTQAMSRMCPETPIRTGRVSCAASPRAMEPRWLRP